MQPTLFSRIRAYSPTMGVYLFAAVFLLRTIVLFRLTSSPFLLPSRGDMFFYNDWALRILHGHWTDHLAFYGLPLYAYLLAAIYSLFGYTPFVPGLCQAALDAGTAVLIYKITDELIGSVAGKVPSATSARPLLGLTASRTFALLAAGGWAVFVPAEAYSIILMPTAWAIFIFWLLVWRTISASTAPTSGEQFLTGLVTGFVAMGIATILFLLPLLWWRSLKPAPKPGASRARRLTIAALVLIAGVIVGSSPCWLHNYFVARDPVALSAHSGINLWIGNNPEANGYPRFPPGLHAGQAALLQDSIEGAEAAVGHPLKRGEVSKFWSGKARDYVSSHPAEWLELVAVKIRNLWSAFQYDDLSIVTALRSAGVLFPGIEFGLVAALALPGVILFWNRAVRSRIVAAAIALHLLALLPVFVTERYRLPMVPGLLVFDALGLFVFWRSLVTGHAAAAALYAVLLALCTAVVSWPQRDPSLWALDAYNSGWQALEVGDFPRAEETLRRAYIYVPTNPEVNFAFGNLRLEQGRAAAASDMYKRTLALDPKHAGAMNNLGVIALDQNRPMEAIDWLRGAIALKQRNGKAHFLLAKALFLNGDVTGARTEADQALSINPAQPEFQKFRSALP